MAITRAQQAKQLLALGGRIGLQEGGIMPRLNQLGSGVSSAEQTLQDINQRLESAESSLGSGGGGFGSGGPLDQGIGPDKLAEAKLSLDKIAPGFKTGQPTGQLSGSIQNLQNQQGVVDLAQLYPNAGQNQINFFRPENSTLRSGIPAASYADGGNVVGGEMDFESARQMYGLGKLVKKATRAVKKVAKSDLGKAAILGALTFGIPGVETGFFSKGLSGTKFGLGAKKFLFGTGLPLAPPSAGAGVSKGILGGLISPVGAAIIGTSVLAGLMTPKQEEQAQALANDEGIDIEAARRSILNAGTSKDLRARAFVAEGGSIKEPVAKKTMPLLDMGGQEMDLRAEGGFVPIGRMEKADDVPARLSKNEFVFTAEAVRNAGEGDVDKGAEVMYNMMKNLEAGGDVSQESQGLEGARRMFQTSQRLEEVL